MCHKMSRARARRTTCAQLASSVHPQRATRLAAARGLAARGGPHPARPPPAATLAWRPLIPPCRPHPSPPVPATLTPGCVRLLPLWLPRRIAGVRKQSCMFKRCQYPKGPPENLAAQAGGAAAHAAGAGVLSATARVPLSENAAPNGYAPAPGYSMAPAPLGKAAAAAAGAALPAHDPEAATRAFDAATRALICHEAEEDPLFWTAVEGCMALLGASNARAASSVVGRRAAASAPYQAAPPPPPPPPPKAAARRCPTSVRSRRRGRPSAGLVGE